MTRGLFEFIASVKKTEGILFQKVLKSHVPYFAGPFEILKIPHEMAALTNVVNN